jgi:hypothetical protein
MYGHPHWEGGGEGWGATFFNSFNIIFEKNLKYLHPKPDFNVHVGMPDSKDELRSFIGGLYLEYFFQISC